MIFETEDCDDCTTSITIRNHASPYMVVTNEGELPLVIINGEIRENAWVTNDHFLAIEAKAVSGIVMKDPEDLLRRGGFHNAAEILKENSNII